MKPAERKAARVGATLLGVIGAFIVLAAVGLVLLFVL